MYCGWSPQEQKQGRRGGLVFSHVCGRLESIKSCLQGGPGKVWTSNGEHLLQLAGLDLRRGARIGSSAKVAIA